MTGGKHTHILVSTVLDAGGLEYRGRPVIESFAQLYRALEAMSGSDGASLFALPERGFSKARNVAVVTWYTDLRGVFRPLNTLSQEERADAESRLSSDIATLIERADDETLELLRLALNIPSSSDVFFNGEAVVLTNWGRLGAGSAVGADRREPPSAMSAYLPAGFALSQIEAEPAEAPSLSISAGPEATAVEMAPPPSSSTLNHSGAPARASTAAAAASGSPGDPDTAGNMKAAAWLSGGALMLGLFLAYALWPGNLVYPTHAARLTPEQTADALGSANRALTDDIRAIQSALGRDVCPAEGAAEVDRIAGLPPLPAIAPGAAPAVTPDASPSPAATRPATQISPTSPRERSALDAQGGDGSRPRTPQSPLVTSLDEGVVLVIGSARDGVGMGSGLLVSPTQVLTNFHVVQDMDGRRMSVINQRSGGAVSAKVIASSPNSDISNADFALLELDRPIDLPRLKLAAPIERLDGVIAAGYPSFVMSSDPSFAAAFRDGDMSRLQNLQIALTRGEVTTKQVGATGVSLLAHSATISPGNSGGPLVDMCGRVVGLNTFARLDAENALRLNFALGAEDAAKFLRSHGVEVPVESAACDADTARRAATVASQAAPAAGPATAVPEPTAQGQAPASPAAPSAPAPSVATPPPAAAPSPSDALTVPSAPGGGR